jgi:hypothetical protein
MTSPSSGACVKTFPATRAHRPNALVDIGDNLHARFIFLATKTVWRVGPFHFINIG